MKMLYFLKRNPVLVGMALLLFILWLFSGTQKDPSHKEQRSKKFHVLVKPSTASLKEDIIQITGHTKASDTADLQAHTKGIVKKILVKSGDAVQKGTLLVKLHENDLRQRVISAHADLKEKTTRYTISKTLSKDNYRSPLENAGDLARMEASHAALKAAEMHLAYTEITAPFSGVVKEIFASIGEVVPLNTRDPVLQLVTLDPLTIVFHINERHHTHVKKGQELTLSWDNRPSRKAMVTYVSPEADMQTHTFKVKATLKNPGNVLPAGLITDIHIPIQKVLAHKIEPASLLLSDDGHQGVRVVDDQNQVRFYPVTLLSSGEKYFWVTGLPETANIITVGHGFVHDGDTVTVSVQKET